MPISHWFSQLDPPPVPRPALPGSREADVCIVGAGFTGLWTAYELRRADPSLDVVVLEAEVAGFGASGRNGGWVLGELRGRAASVGARGGREACWRCDGRSARPSTRSARGRARRASTCDFVKGGSLHVAQTPLQLERLRAHVAAEDAHGARRRTTGASCSTPRRAAARIDVDGVRRRALHARTARACSRRGWCAAWPAPPSAPGRRSTRRTPVHADRAGRGAHRRAARCARRVVVRATEGYTADLPGQRRALVPLNSSMIVTEPLDAATWAQLGWERRRDAARRRSHVYVYLQRTADGRIAIGGRGVPYRFGSRTDREGPLPAAHRRTSCATGSSSCSPPARRRASPHAWHGVLGVPRDWSPPSGSTARPAWRWAGGYVGEGVGAANLAGRTLRDLVLERDTELTALPWVGPLAPRAGSPSRCASPACARSTR